MESSDSHRQREQFKGQSTSPAFPLGEGVGRDEVKPLALIPDGRPPVSRETPAKLLSPAAPYPRLGWAAFAVAVFGVALVLLGDHNIVELGALLVVLSVPLAVLFAVMAVVVKRR